MPGKPFYSIDEVCAKLGKTADEVKGLVRGGTLREFRDAGKVFFKADDIDKLARGVGSPPPQAGSEDTGEILLEPVADTAAPEGKPLEDLSSLADSSGGTSIIGLEPLAEEEEKKGDTAITTRGVGVFDEDEVEMGVGRYLPEELESGREQLRRLYRSRGFAAAAIDRPEVSARAFPARRLIFAPWQPRVPLKLDLNIPVIEGPVFTMTSVRVEGEAKAASPEVVRLMRSLRVPSQYDYAVLESTRENILKILGHRGYGRARVDLVQRFGASAPP